MNEVDDVSVGHSIVEVAERPAQDQGQSELQQSVPWRVADTVDNYHDSRHRGERRQKGSLAGRADRRKNTEGDAGVTNVCQFEEAASDRQAVTQAERVLNYRLRPSVQKQYDTHQTEVGKTRTNRRSQVAGSHILLAAEPVFGFLNYGILTMLSTSIDKLVEGYLSIR